MTGILAFLAKLKPFTWLKIGSYIFVLLLGVSVRCGCNHHGSALAPKTVTVIRWDTLPRPAAVHDTVRLQALHWQHDTIPLHDTVLAGKVEQIEAVAACEAFDTTIQGARIDYRQCFLLPDSVIRRAARPPVFSLQLPAPIRETTTNTTTVPVYKNRPINWTVELLKAGIFAGLGIWAGTKL
jgi:hypothetical protein